MNHAPLRIVKASAGSGKTFTLALQYLILIFSNPKNYQKILAVTFTNKATSEMKERILNVLRFLAEPQNTSIFNPYREKILEIFPQKTAEILQIEADGIYREMIHHYQKFSVSTIDGFMQKVIRSFAFELGLDSQFALELNIQNVQTTLEEQLDALLPQKPKLLAFLLNLIYFSINEGKGYQYLQQTEVYFKEIFKERYTTFEQVLLSFNSPEDLNQVLEQLRKISNEIIENFDNQIIEFEEKAEIIFDNHEHIGTILRNKSRSKLFSLTKLGTSTLNASLFDYLIDDDLWFQAKEHNAEFKSEITALLKEIKVFSDQNLNTYVLSQKLQNNFVYVSLMQEMALLLRDYRNDAKKILISDTQKILNGILGNDENPAFVWEKMGQQYQYFLFDEFQDTSNQQWNSFKPLLENALSEAQDDNIPHHLIVGDVKQAIYRWRSGNWEILHSQAEKNFEYFSGVESLKDNRRSAKNIIAFNNELFQKLPKTVQTFVNQFAQENSDEVKTWWEKMGYNTIIEKVYENSDQLFPEQAPPDKQGGTVKISVIEKTKNTEEQHTEDDEDEFQDLSILSNMIAEIRMLQEERQYALSDIAVLVRRNSEAEKVVKALLNENLAVISGEALKLAQNDAIKFIINILYALFSTPKNQTLYWAEAAWLYCKIHSLPFDRSHWQSFKKEEFKKNQLIFPKAFYVQMDRWKNYDSRSLLEEIILVFELDKLPENQLYLLKLRDIFEQQNQFGDQGIPTFLDWWQTDGFDINLPALNNVDAIQVLTIHKSKGLDFRAVLIPFCSWPLKPSSSNTIIYTDLSHSPFEILKQIPVKFHTDLFQTTAVYNALEEVLQSAMEALNMLYVATTRSVDYLHIFIESKKEYSQFTKIGHAIIQSWGATTIAPEGKAKKPKVEYILAEGYVVDEFIPKTIHKNIDNQDFHIPNRQKTISQLDAILFQTQKFRKLNENRDLDYGKEGKIMHDILSLCHHTSEVENAVKKAQIKYNFPDEEIPKWTEQSISIINNPTLKHLFEQGEVLSEQSLIDAEGNLFRPDKIIVKPNGEAIVLDYKFTQKEEESHIAQVKTYQNLLHNMGYQNVDAYLYYEKTNHLMPIH